MIIDHIRLLALANRIVTAGGSSPAEAAIVAEHLVEANLCGHDSHGHTSANPEPLCSPKGSTTPRCSLYITEGSVVGWPVWSSNAPSSIGFPELCATLTFPIATPAPRQ